MDAMLRRFLPGCTVLLVASALLLPAAFLRAQDNSGSSGSSSSSNRWTRKYKTPPQASRIEVTVLKDYNGKPVEDAAVIFHPIEGDKDKGALELKSNEDGKAVVDVIPIGDTVRLQVIANGYQTYGGDYKIDKPEITMEVRLKRPGSQYSIYKNNTPTASNGNGGAGKAGSGDQSAPPAQGDKSGGSGNSQSNSNSGSQSGSQSDQNQNQNQNQSQKQNP
jgi:hypothetical protein